MSDLCMDMIADIPKRWAGRTWLLGIAIIMAIGCTNQTDPQPPLRSVRVVHVNESALSDSVSFAGEVTARHETELSFRVPGKLIERHVEVGSLVHKGQWLAQLDPTDYRLELQGLNAQLASSHSERDFAKEDLARYRELLNRNLISLPEFDRHKMLYKTASERTAVLQAQLDKANFQLAYTNLAADWDGVITELKVEVGQVVSVGQPIAKLASLNEKEISIQVPEHRINKVLADQKVEIVLWADSEQRRFQGRVREIASAADPISRTYAVKVTLLEGHAATKIGMTATVWFPSSLTHRIVVPLSAVFTPHSEPKQSRVWRVDEHSFTVASMSARLGELVGADKVVITDGLVKGDLIVSAGAHRLVEGERIRILENTLEEQSASTGERP